MRDASTAVKAGVAAVVGLVVFGLVVIASTSSGGGSAWGTTIAVLVGLLAVAAAFTPTMPAVWRAGCAATGVVGLVLGTTVTWSDSEFSGWGALIPLVPALLAGVAGFGWWQNQRTGATASAPGWAGAGSAPPAPPHPVPFPLPPTAGGRSRVCLEARTGLDPATVAAAVARVTAVRGNWFVVQGDAVTHAPTTDGRQLLTIGRGTEFRARTRQAGGGTLLRVGGLDRWVQSRNYWAGFVPAGFAHVQGYWAYKCYLQTLAAELVRLDPACRITIGTPSGEIG